jgi:hypothetical protein
MDFRRNDWAMESARVTIWGKDDLDVDEAFVGIQGSPTTVPGLKQAPSRDRRRELLSGDPAQISRQIAAIIEKHTT